ncbi:glycosyltransferase [Pseudanabaena sp. 'Roaring Creek']|uniref:glycosyltransferase n=1 Tax=Pseudanabaena sp. 'Roaring Creek' TaxID=1681830 RepID=UPI0006D77311|nr:glycosyltransferase [Pseudanabaena sp. 'Roaring Creek']
MEFQEAIEKIKSGIEEIDQHILLPYLSSEKATERFYYNFHLAQAFVEVEKFEQAKSFIERAWFLSRFSEEVLPLYILINKQLQDVSAIQQAYKRLGMIASKKGKIIDSINYFNQSMYAYAQTLGIDKYNYDYDILDCIENMAKSYRFYPKKRSLSSNTFKIKVAYLTYLATVETSVFYRINLTLAQFHDKSKFEIAFFIPRPESEFVNSNDIIGILEEHNCQVVLTPSSNYLSEEEALIWIAKKIYQFSPDILVTNAGLADLRQYFIMSLTPASVIVNSLYAGPAQYVSPNADWSIASAIHPLLDSPCNTSLIGLELDLTEHKNIGSYDKKFFKIPDDSLVILSAGRPQKFQDIEFWKVIIDLINLHQDLYYVAIGLNQDQLPISLPKEISSRFRILKWREDYLKILGIADIVIDTYPSGGGFTLVDAMALGIPVITFANDYMKLYDQVNWSLGDELVLIPDLIIERGNPQKVIEEISKLISDTYSRHDTGQKCQEFIYNSRGHPERFVKSYEDIYKKIISGIVYQNDNDWDKHILSTFNRGKLFIKYKIQRIIVKIKRRLKGIVQLMRDEC